MTTKSEDNTSLLEFPCRFPIKAMGKNTEDFEVLVTGIVLKHAQLWPDEVISATPSKEGNYVSVTAIVKAQSQQQLDAIYQELTDSDQVKMAL